MDSLYARPGNEACVFLSGIVMTLVHLFNLRERENEITDEQREKQIHSDRETRDTIGPFFFFFN